MAPLVTYWPIAAGIVTLYILQKLWIEYSHRRRARALGCKPAYRRRGWLPLSVDQVYRAINALKENDFLNAEVRIYHEIGQKTTFQQSSLGNTFYMTTDPENIKAILATQFKDFGLGPIRYNVLEPLLGRGIFTSDGKDWFVQLRLTTRVMACANYRETGSILEPSCVLNLRAHKYPTSTSRRFTCSTC